MPDPDPNAPPAGGTPPPAASGGTPPPAATGTPPPAKEPPKSGSEDVAALQARLAAAEKRVAELTPEAAKAAQLQKEKDDAAAKQLEEQGKFKELAAQRAGEVSKVQQRLVRAEIRAAAIQQGVIDPELVQLIPIDDAMLVNGEPDLEKITAAVTAYKAKKPQLFQAPAAQGGTGGGTPPPARTGAGGAPPPAKPDAGGLDVRDRAKYNPQQVNEEYEKFRRTLAVR